MAVQPHKDMDQAFAKRRHFWKPGGVRLLREASWATYAQRAVPPTVNGFQIHFPKTTTALGLQFSSWTCRLPGDPLLAMLYEPNFESAAILVGMTVLEAFQLADPRLLPSGLSGWIFRLVKGLRLGAQLAFRSSLLTTSEKTRLKQLMRRYILGRTKRVVLVHGDLHVAHVLVDLNQGTLGIIDLEAMHVGKAATNFAQLWDGFHYADAALGRRLFDQYTRKYGTEIDDQFDNDVRFEIAMRSHTHIWVGRQTENRELTEKASRLLHMVLSGASSFRSICSEGMLE